MRLIRNKVLRLTLAGWAAASSFTATACVRVHYPAHGFSVKADERLGVNLPANARGVIFYAQAEDGSKIQVRPGDFVLTDRFHRPVPIDVIPVTPSPEDYRYFVRPKAGFAVGEAYILRAIGVQPAPNAPYAAEIMVVIGPPLDPGALAGDASIVTGRATEVLLGGASATYASRVTRELRAPDIPPQTDCDMVPSETIRPAPGCHVILASLWFPEVDDREVRLAALVCGGWLAMPWPRPS